MVIKAVLIFGGIGWCEGFELDEDTNCGTPFCVGVGGSDGGATQSLQHQLLV